MVSLNNYFLFWFVHIFFNLCQKKLGSLKKYSLYTTIVQLLLTKPPPLYFKPRVSITQVTMVAVVGWHLTRRRSCLISNRVRLCLELACFPQSEWTPAGFACFFSQSKHMKFRLIVDSEFPVGTNVSRCLSLVVRTVINRWPLQGLPSVIWP